MHYATFNVCGTLARDIDLKAGKRTYKTSYRQLWELKIKD